MIMDAAYQKDRRRPIFRQRHARARGRFRVTTFSPPGMKPRGRVPFDHLSLSRRPPSRPKEPPPDEDLVPPGGCGSGSRQSGSRHRSHQQRLGWARSASFAEHLRDNQTGTQMTGATRPGRSLAGGYGCAKYVVARVRGPGRLCRAAPGPVLVGPVAISRKAGEVVGGAAGAGGFPRAASREGGAGRQPWGIGGGPSVAWLLAGQRDRITSTHEPPADATLALGTKAAARRSAPCVC